MKSRRMDGHSSWVAAIIEARHWVGRKIKGVFVTPPTAAEARVAEKDRQWHARRELRGLE